MSFVFVAVLSSNLWAGNLLVVNKAGGAPYTEIQPAVNAAQDGDTVFVKAGHYAAVTIDGKALRLVGEIPGGVVIDSSAVGLQIRNVAAGKTVVVRELLVNGGATMQPSLLVDGNLGAVRIEICDFQGKNGISYAAPSGDAALVRNSADVAFSHCHFFGGNGRSALPNTNWDGGYGAEGIEVRNSTIAIYVCEFTGGAGGNGIFGGWGGDGFKILGPEPSQVFAAQDNWFRGGNGGDTTDWFENAPGGGGDGLVHVAGSTVHSLANQFFAGKKGKCDPAGGFCGGGSAGTQISGNGQFLSIPGPSRRIDPIWYAIDGFDLPISVRGQPGDKVVLLVSSNAGFTWNLPWKGIMLVSPSIQRMVMGTLPAIFSIPIRESLVDPGKSRDLIVQPIFVGADGITLGNAQNTVILDSAP